jgi:hypothetical protein
MLQKTCHLYFVRQPVSWAGSQRLIFFANLCGSKAAGSESISSGGLSRLRLPLAGQLLRLGDLRGRHVFRDYIPISCGVFVSSCC